MIKNKRLIPAFLTLNLLVSVLGSSLVGAQDYSDAQLQQIKASCASAKATLNRLHSGDALMRVNVGQIYEAISTRLMDGFGLRVGKNKFDNSALLVVSNDYETQLNNFRVAYISYENQLSKAIGISCTNNPAEFYEAVVDARTKRSLVREDVLSLNQYVDDYMAAVNNFESKSLTNSEASQ